MMRIIEELAGDWHRLERAHRRPVHRHQSLADQDPACERLMTVPGIGPIISSAMVAAIGNGAMFSKGRDLGAWLGLVPRQMSTGDRTILGKISKQKLARPPLTHRSSFVLMGRNGESRRACIGAFDEAIATCGGDVRAALRATLVANAYLESEVERLTDAISTGFARGRMRRPPQRVKI
jgi:hypothetical protein